MHHIVIFNAVKNTTILFLKKIGMLFMCTGFFSLSLAKGGGGRDHYKTIDEAHAKCQTLCIAAAQVIQRVNAQADDVSTPKETKLTYGRLHYTTNEEKYDSAIETWEVTFDSEKYSVRAIQKQVGCTVQNVQLL